ncbi:MAG: O-antigen translocase [Bacteroidales bacterium]|nr:O-antigen translocase [Bacteroidales bacterium]
MSEQQSAYKQIMKATSIFGGVQVFQIIIKIISSKFIAVLLGPLGMGIAGLLTSTTGFIAALTNFGLSTSAVRDVAAAHSTGNELRVRTTVTVFRRLVWYTGLLGALLTLVLSPWLSQISFGNRDYIYAFMIISVTLLINQLSAGQSVLLRGMRQIKYLAKSSVIGSFLGLFTTIPLYYFFGVDGIVPGIIVTAITAFMLTWYFARKVNVKPIYVSRLRTIAEGKGMLKMGFMISLSGLIALGASYIVRLFISNTGGVDQVGLYSAGFAIINTYVGLIFTAMSTDYYPRLSAVAHDNSKSIRVINQQAEIALLILAPIIMVFLVFINWVVIILYSNKFLAVNDMILFAALGMFFKAASWSIAFIFLAKGESKLFFWNELITNIYLLALNLTGYSIYGLTGLGISFLISYLLYLVQVFTISKIRYKFEFTVEFNKVFFPQLILAILCFIIIKFVQTPQMYFLGSIIILISFIFSLDRLNKKLNLQEMLSKYFNR